MRSRYTWRSAPLFGLLTALCLLAACSTQRAAVVPSRAATTAVPTQAPATATLRPQATATTVPTAQWTATATSHPRETVVREATATPSAPATATSTPTATIAVGSTPVSVLTGPGFVFEGWSPTGDVFAFRSFAVAQLQMGGPYPRGTWHFHEAGTGATCQYPASNELGLDWNGWHAWLPDGGMLLFNAPPEGGPRELVRLHRPCSEEITNLSGLFPEPVSVSASNADNSLFLLRGKDAFYLYEPLGGTVRSIDALQGLALDGFSFSPGDVYLGATLATGTTYVVRANSGQLEEVVPWSFSLGGLGDLGGPLWLNDGQFLIRRSDTGPLLVTLGSDPQPVAPTFFGQRSASHQSASGAGVPGSDAFYLILADYGPEYTESRNWLYHSASGLVEVLDASYTAIVADGRWLSLIRGVDVEGYERTQVWARPLEPAGAHATILSGVGDATYPGWSPKGTTVAVANEVTVGQVATLQLRSVPDGGVLQSWEVGNYNLSRVYWSPDGRYLVAIGQVPVLDDSQYFPWQRLYTLFLFPVEPSLAGTLEGRGTAAVPPELVWTQCPEPDGDACSGSGPGLLLVPTPTVTPVPTLASSSEGARACVIWHSRGVSSSHTFVGDKNPSFGRCMLTLVVIS
jgi:hypothetical protein